MHSLPLRPWIRYQAGKDAKLLATVSRILPDWLLDGIRLRALHLPSRFGAIADARDR
jgi:hypothetical protein